MKAKIKLLDIQKKMTNDNLQDFRLLVKVINKIDNQDKHFDILYNMLLEKYDNLLNEVFQNLDNKRGSVKGDFYKYVKLAPLVLEHPLPNIEIEDMLEVNLNKTIKITYDFFNSLNEEYGYRFLNILNEPLIDEKNKKVYANTIFNSELNPRYDLPIDTGVFNNGMTNIVYNNTLDDVISLVHEITHKFSYQNEGKNKLEQRTIFNVFQEVPPITMEFLLRDYLQKLYPDEDINKYFLSRFQDTYNQTKRLFLEYVLYKIYKLNENYLSLDIIKSYFANLDYNSLEYKLFGDVDEFDEMLIDIVNPDDGENPLRFPDASPYLLGTLLGIDLYLKIKANPDALKDFYTLIEILGNNDLNIKTDLQTLKELGINLFNEAGKLVISDDIISQFQASYSTMLNDFTVSFKDNLQR